MSKLLSNRARFHPDMRSGIPLGTLNQRLERGTFTRKVKLTGLNQLVSINLRNFCLNHF